jgi:hypothetical protein
MILGQSDIDLGLAALNVIQLIVLGYVGASQRQSGQERVRRQAEEDQEEEQGSPSD